MEQAMSAAGANLPCPKIVRGQEELTPEQAAYARQFIQERIAALFSTAAIDEGEAEEHLRAAYQVAGLEPPQVRWFNSPLAFFFESLSSVLADPVLNLRLAAGVLSNKDARQDDVSDDVGAGLWANVWTSVQANIGPRVWVNVRLSVEDSMQGRVWRHLEGIVEAGVRASTWGTHGIPVRDSVQAYFHGTWLSFARFFHEVFEENELIHFARFNEMVSGYRLGRKEAWLVRKPLRLERDEQGRLHSADRMAIQFRDGWGFYAWHGTMCSEDLILHPEQITRDVWMNESNLEIRRLMQERLGNERFVELIGGRCINQGQYADLIEVDLGHDPEKVARFVRVKDSSTERVYYVRVPRKFRKADAALAWTFGLKKRHYRPTQQA